MTGVTLDISRANGARSRFASIMRRHVVAEDADLSDDALVRVVFARYEKARGIPLIDPNE